MKKLWVFTGILAMFLLTLAAPENALSKSEENKAACEKWCNANKPTCEKCYRNTSCGGRWYEVIKSFKKGTGNWYACGLSKYARESMKNEDECEKWCNNNPDCNFCSQSSACNFMETLNGSRLKKFGGRGNNWYACRYTTRALFAKERLEQCTEMCKNWEACHHCTTKSCGAGFKIIGTFRGKGSTVFACQKR